MAEIPRNDIDYGAILDRARAEARDEFVTTFARDLAVAIKWTYSWQR